MKIKYSRDADVLVIQLREGKPADSRDIAEGIIVHLTAKGQPLEIEILDASKVVQKKDVEVALDPEKTKGRMQIAEFPASYRAKRSTNKRK